MSAIHPAEAEARLSRLLENLEQVTEQYSDLVVQAAMAEAEYRIAYADAIQSAKGKTVAEKEATATLRCSRELMARKVADGKAEAARMGCYSLRSQIEGVRSILASSREQVR